MYKPVVDKIKWWAEKEDVPYDFLMEVAERRKEEVIGWEKFDAERFGYEYEEDENYICDEILDSVNGEAYNYLDFIKSEEERKENEEN